MTTPERNGTTPHGSLFQFLKAAALIVTIFPLLVLVVLAVVALPIMAWHTWGVLVPFSLMLVGLISIVSGEM